MTEPLLEAQLRAAQEELQQLRGQLAQLQSVLAQRALMDCGVLIDVLSYTMQAARNGNPIAGENLRQLAVLLKDIEALGSNLVVARQAPNLVRLRPPGSTDD